MKKATSFLVFSFSLAAFLFAQNVPAPTQTKLKNTNASGARVLSIQEMNTMRTANELSVGAYYVVQAQFNAQYDHTVNLEQNDGSILYADADFYVDIPELSDVDALLTVSADILGRPRQIILVEIVLR